MRLRNVLNQRNNGNDGNTSRSHGWLARHPFHDPRSTFASTTRKALFITRARSRIFRRRGGMAALERPRRAEAGRNIAKLLNQEEAAADDFYNTAYGGFGEDGEDNEYEVSSN